MPLLNYTTKVDVYTTLGAIQGQTLFQAYRSNQFMLEGQT